jgi:hypothetical protein
MRLVQSNPDHVPGFDFCGEESTERPLLSFEPGARLSAGLLALLNY